MKYKIFITSLFLVLFSSFNANAKEVPYLSGRVVDEMGLLDMKTLTSIEQKLKAHEESTSNQVAVLIVKTLDGEVLESYSLKVFTTWKLGQKDKDNGVLLLIAVKDRRLRIEVGYGLEGSLTDLKGGRIIRNVIVPEFKRGNFPKGIEAGVDAILGTIEGTYAPGDKDGGELDEFDMDLTTKERIFIGVFVIPILLLFFLIGVMTNWFLYLFLLPFWALFTIPVVGVPGNMWFLGGHIVLYPILRIMFKSGFFKGINKWLDSVDSGGSSWSSSSSSGGFFSGSSSWSSGGSSWSGGGFSGGGGSCGGGGASGSW
jgi:uncharacterized protein